MSSVAKAALENHLSDNGPGEAEEGDPEDASPFRDALREAWQASKSGDADAFAEAFEAAIEIKLAER